MKTSRVVAAALLVAPLAAQAGQTISKCQDAQGQWHYGNYASEVCGDRPITELRESGVTLEVHEAPPTAEELQAQKQQEQAAREAQMKKEEKLRVDRTLKQKYASEDVIVALRDQRLGELDKQLKFNREQLAKLREEQATMPQPSSEYEQQEAFDLAQRVERFERAIERNLVASQKTRDDYAKLLDRYRQIDLPEVN